MCPILHKQCGFQQIRPNENLEKESSSASPVCVVRNTFLSAAFPVSLETSHEDVFPLRTASCGAILENSHQGSFDDLENIEYHIGCTQEKENVIKDAPSVASAQRNNSFATLSSESSETTATDKASENPSARNIQPLSPRHKKNTIFSFGKPLSIKQSDYAPPSHRIIITQGLGATSNNIASSNAFRSQYGRFKKKCISKFTTNKDIDHQLLTTSLPAEETNLQKYQPSSVSTMRTTTGAPPHEDKTTIMLRNIPNKYTQEMLLQVIDKKFKGLYDFFYLPIDFQNKCNVGYAFINFIDHSHALSFKRHFTGHKLDAFKSSKVCEVCWGRVQGLQANIQHYKNSAVMTISDFRYKPILFSNGETVEFPVADRCLPIIKLRHLKI